MLILMVLDNTVCLYAILRDCVDEVMYRRRIVDAGDNVIHPHFRERTGEPRLQYDDLVDDELSITSNVENWRRMLKKRAAHINKNEHTAYEMTRLTLLIRMNTRHG